MGKVSIVLLAGVFIGWFLAQGEYAGVAAMASLFALYMFTDGREDA